jgi:hypothetical protein
MPYYCDKCGEENKFTSSQGYTEWGSETIYIDKNGEIDDYGDRDSNDSETGDRGDVYCGKCGQEVNDYEEGPELEEAKQEYLNKKREQEAQEKKKACWKNRILGVKEKKR